MEHDQDMHAHSSDDAFTIYPPSLHPYSTSFMAPHFGTPHRQDQHEADHVYDSPQLTLDPSTLDLRSNSNQEPRPASASTNGSNNTTPTGSLRFSAYHLPNLSSPGVTTRRRARAALEQLQIQIQVPIQSEHVSPHHHSGEDQRHDDHQQQQSDMHDIHMQSGEMQMHVDDSREHGLISNGIGHGQGHGATLSQNVCLALHVHCMVVNRVLFRCSACFLMHHLTPSTISPPTPLRTLQQVLLHLPTLPLIKICRRTVQLPP